MDEIKTLKILLSLAVIGSVVAIGKILQSGEKIPFWQALGRVILGGAMGMGSAAILQVYPNMSMVVLGGISSAISVLGVDGVIMVFKKVKA